MHNRENIQRVDITPQHFASWQEAIKEAITTALARNNWQSTAVALPLALANRAANDIAHDNQFRILTAEEVTSAPEEAKEQGLIVYVPTFMEESERERIIAYLRAYATNKIVILFVLLTQDIPTPDHSLLKNVWAAGLFRRGELYEVGSSCRQITLNALKLVHLPLSQGWRRKHIASWPGPFMGTSVMSC